MYARVKPKLNTFIAINKTILISSLFQNVLQKAKSPYTSRLAQYLLHRLRKRFFESARWHCKHNNKAHYKMRKNRFPTNVDEPVKWHVLYSFGPYLLEFKHRVFLALLCLVAAKLASIGYPVLKYTVDSLNGDLTTLALAVPISLIVAYGTLRLLNVCSAKYAIRYLGGLQSVPCAALD